MPEQIGYLTSMGLNYGWGPTSMMEWLLEHIHIYTGLPWFGSIALTAIVIRIALFKPALDATETGAKFTELRKNPRFAELMTARMEAFRDPERRMEGMVMSQEIKQMQKQAGIKMWKTFVPLLQIPLGFGMFRLLRGMAELPIPALETGGLAWFMNLTVPDPLFILPLVSTGIMWWIMKVSNSTSAVEA
jgi:YidC/Oxa1 family membrane protein insertase